MRLARQTGMFGEALLCPEQISAGALRPNEGGGQSKTALGGAARGYRGISQKIPLFGRSHRNENIDQFTASETHKPKNLQLSKKVKPCQKLSENIGV
ncbi:hypothetical protein J3U37_10365 [Gilliamella sp. B3172]|uniref:hypothetical protein n=1 Tax=Gilliamella sp. B3172 TaxID=2818006 RepID=UPI00226A5CCF|nr:hypothetical protein [Gilliamella sp. B3172]MCX8640509.1 hypothetical protein [Gilliamella sp. B3172]